MRNEICSLILETVEGAEVSQSENEIFCERRSCTRREFYAAYGVGLNPSFVLAIDPGDYNNFSTIDAEGKKKHSETVRYDGEIMNIIRTYEKDDSTMEMTVG